MALGVSVCAEEGNYGVYVSERWSLALIGRMGGEAKMGLRTIM